MSEGHIVVAEHNGASILKLTGEVRLVFSATINQFIDGVLEKDDFSGVVIDLTEAEFLDSTTLGMLVKLAKGAQEKSGQKPLLYYQDDDLVYLISSMGCDALFCLVKGLLPSKEHLSDWRRSLEAQEGESEIQACVLEAHRELMTLNAQNRLQFRGLVEMLEANQGQLPH